MARIGIAGHILAIIGPSGRADFTAPGDHCWTVPAGVAQLSVTVIGGGGAGGMAYGAGTGGDGGASSFGGFEQAGGSGGGGARRVSGQRLPGLDGAGAVAAHPDGYGAAGAAGLGTIGIPGGRGGHGHHDTRTLPIRPGESVRVTVGGAGGRAVAHSWQPERDGGDGRAGAVLIRWGGPSSP